MKQFLILTTVLLFSCQPAGSPGLCSIHAQSTKYTLNTTQKCMLSDEAREVADLAQLLSLQALADAKVLSYTDAVKSLAKGLPMVCVVEHPEPCCFSGFCAGPYNPSKTKAARKAGCSSPYHAWASLTWPPVCNSDWTDEPHCVPAPLDKLFADGYDWKETLRHEVFNMTLQRWTKIYDPSYRDKIYTEVEPLVKERFDAITTLRTLEQEK